MNQESHVLMAAMQESSGVEKGKLDMVLLSYMTRRLHLTLLELDKPGSGRQKRPQVFKLQERRGRLHRAIVYQKRKLLGRAPLTFVGLISAREEQLRLPPCIVNEIQRSDKKLIEELASAPGILSYSSLELRNGGWCNLVLLSNADARTHIHRSETLKYAAYHLAESYYARMHIRSSQTPQYAAYHLAESYYKWIRLHEGVMTEGLDHMEMQLQKTKYYTFQTGQQSPTIRQLIFELSYPEQPIVGRDIVPPGTNTF